jgi:hypothetical protein
MEVLAKDRILELSEQLDVVLHEQPIRISKARQINRQIGAAAEEDALIRQTIQDLARHGLPTIRTQRWITAMQKDRPDGGSPEAA